MESSLTKLGKVEEEQVTGRRLEVREMVIIMLIMVVLSILKRDPVLYPLLKEGGWVRCSMSNKFEKISL